VQSSEAKKIVDLLIDVLNARVGDHGGAVTLGEILGRLDEDLTGCLRFQTQDQFPRKDPSREIV
jgi:hypothetical protein